jgi:alpha-glucosidase
LVELGVDALWISPIFPSPMRDFGYDVSNYCDVDPTFGTLDDHDALISEVHAREMKIILDWVPNHSSSDHPWFVESSSSRDSAKRDWYVWRSPVEGNELPNNWIRAWSDQSTWTWSETTEQYYLHCFLPSQPDLNWSNVAVREAMHDTLRFWLNRGVDGFRMDVIHLVGKELDVDDDPEMAALSHVPLNDVEITHEYLREIRTVINEFPDRVSVGEVYLFDPKAVATYYGQGDELHLSFNFASLMTPWRAEAWRDLIAESEAMKLTVDAWWPTWVLSNHDNARVASRLGGDPERVRAAMMLLLSLRGTPFLYAGEELGLLDAEIPPDRIVDPGGRDGCRAPIPWSNRPGWGWPAEPWLPFVDDVATVNAEKQMADSGSILSFTKELLLNRRGHTALRTGELANLQVDGDVLSFERVAQDDRVGVAVNFGKSPAKLPWGQQQIRHSLGTITPEGGLPPGGAVWVELS